MSLTPIKETRWLGEGRKFFLAFAHGVAADKKTFMGGGRGCFCQPPRALSAMPFCPGFVCGSEGAVTRSCGGRNG